MKVVGLISGGKDSCFAMMKCVQFGHQIVALANLMPADDSVDELDSYMYQTVGHQIVVSYSKCMGVPLFRRKIQGSTRHHELSYNMTAGDEVEDMFILLKEVKHQIPSITGVSSGAIASDYQRLRVESVCSRLGLISLAYLWKEDQSLLLREMVAAIGLNPSKHLGKELSELSSHLHKLKELYGINVCGEGGEYETLTLDCPLFENARLLLDEYQIVLHSSDSIAPVGILHPSGFHVEQKLKADSRANGVSSESMDSVYEVQGDCTQSSDADCSSTNKVFDFVTQEHHRLHVSEMVNDNMHSISCTLQNSRGTLGDLEEDLKLVLMKIESQLVEIGCSWNEVLYIHMYIADMGKFSVANETYVNFITHEKCLSGVPSRSTVELPLSQVGMGAACVEILVAKNQCKKVLHVQSISCWAPSCIGPYSQATLHNEILYMAGQLGLDPPTMLLCDGGATAELEKALENSEAVAKCFTSSISTSAILFTIYCSTTIPSSDRIKIQEKMNMDLSRMKLHNLNNGSLCTVLNPMFLYVLVPDLPKRAFVEVKPMLYVADSDSVEPGEVVTDEVVPDVSLKVAQNYWGFQNNEWHDCSIQNCIVPGKVCAVVLSITDELAVKICSNGATGAVDDGVAQQCCFSVRQLEMIARFCLYRLDTTLLMNYFSWDNVKYMRIYFPTSLGMSHDMMLQVFIGAFNELAESNPRINIKEKPIFNLVPVLGAGKSAVSLDVLTCELFALKS
ncbi:diphthine--ammonia ligase isoform X2 [Apium graveolens]|uniref:diphthine--ammonia ligase isoform X2 n=1 Tax=Apium graveolens TaxID=4045 RepID=UPI003D78D3F9